ATANHPNGLYRPSITNTFNVLGQQSVADSYDAAGNVTNRLFSDGRSQALSWDAFGRLLRITEKTGASTNYVWTAVYDGLGRRLRTIYNPGGTNSAASLTLDSWFDPQVEFLEVAVEVNGQRTWKVYGPDLSGVYGGMQGVGGLEASVRESDNAQTGLLNDHFGHALGTIIGISLSWNHTRVGGYGPLKGYSAPSLSLSVSPAEAAIWRGLRIDPSGYYWLGARHYDPVSSRFLSPDPLGHTASLDLYSAFNGDSVNYFDPDGRLGREWTDKSTSMNVDSVWSFFQATSYGVAGSILRGVGATPFVMDQAGQRMGEARSQINQYEGGRAFLARSLMLPADFAFGNTRFVTDPVDSIAGIPRGLVGLANKIEADFSSASQGLSVNRVFDISEDLLAIYGLYKGGASLYNGGKSLLADKTISIVEFPRTTDEFKIRQLPHAAYGHVGVSFDDKRIFGFGPTGSGITREALLAREVFPGIVTDDTAIFQQAQTLELNVKTTSFTVSGLQFWKARTAVALDQGLGFLFQRNNYMFPPKSGGWPANTYNCATYPTSVGLPTTHPSGRLSR
ncbi:MAG TPA: RHS repeat-associated core domain-containing protein, partial [Clostridia bacterium]|nr:RHS repeat-associated core domain-containing protein [Clostridia bacterium]